MKKLLLLLSLLLVVGCSSELDKCIEANEANINDFFPSLSEKENLNRCLLIKELIPTELDKDFNLIQTGPMKDFNVYACNYLPSAVSFLTPEGKFFSNCYYTSRDLDFDGDWEKYKEKENALWKECRLETNKLRAKNICHAQGIY